MQKRIGKYLRLSRGEIDMITEVGDDIVFGGGGFTLGLRYLIKIGYVVHIFIKGLYPEIIERIVKKIREAA